MKLWAFIFLGLASNLASSLVLAHGENKPGPHGGFIKMPGAFHTEIVPQGVSLAKVYLLDVGWKNPSVKDASVEMTFKSKGPADCKTKDNYFHCSLPKGASLEEKGQLLVKAKREKQVGNEVTYDLPLKFENLPGEHSGHH